LKRKRVKIRKSIVGEYVTAKRIKSRCRRRNEVLKAPENVPPISWRRSRMFISFVKDGERCWDGMTNFNGSGVEYGSIHYSQYDHYKKAQMLHLSINETDLQLNGLETQLTSSYWNTMNHDESQCELFLTRMIKFCQFVLRGKPIIRNELFIKIFA
jgi:hypothetical protein